MTNNVTPGPWTVQESRDGGKTLSILKHDGHPISPAWVVASVNHCMGSESEANAAAIAAVPELVEFVRSVAIAPCSGDDCLNKEGGLCDACAATRLLARAGIEI